MLVEAHEPNAPFGVGMVASVNDAPSSAVASPNCAAAASTSKDAKYSVPPADAPTVPLSVAVVHVSSQTYGVVTSASICVMKVLAGSVANVRSYVTPLVVALV